jgi:hypothetical protein
MPDLRARLTALVADMHDRAECLGSDLQIAAEVDQWADRLAALLREPPEAPDIDALRQAKDAAYEERDRLVCALSKLWPAHLARHSDSDTTWEDDWRWIVCIHSPVGQLTWHIHDAERPWFDYLDVREGDWDGHTTEDKYARLAALLREPSMAAPHEHVFYSICRDCGQTEAAIEGCHHCNEVKVGERCWWCLRVRVGAAAPEKKADA